jgi:hypothetical protein
VKALLEPLSQQRWMSPRVTPAGTLAMIVNPAVCIHAGLEI